MDPDGQPAQNDSDHASTADEADIEPTQYRAEHASLTDMADIDIAISADHLRHTARTVQQLTAALSVHLALCTNDLQAAKSQAQPGPALQHTHQPSTPQSVQGSTATTHQILTEDNAAGGEEEC